MIPKNETERQVVPRWLSLKRTIEARELDSAPQQARKIVPATEIAQVAKYQFEQRLREWHEERDFPAAEELIAAAAVLGAMTEEVAAAARLIASDDHALPGSRELANLVLGLRKHTDDIALNTKARAVFELARRKKLITRYPRDSLLLAETALLYTITGEIKSAEHLLRQALAVSPNDRYVLRSAARFWFHTRKPDFAVATLSKSPALHSDPWLIAATLAIESAMHRSPTVWREARNMLSREQHSSHDLAELAAAVGTLHLSSGSHRQARKRFRQTLIDPTENALAQVQWARDKDKEIGEVKIDSAPRAFEAMALERYSAQDWQASLEAANQWLAMEAFSIRPALHGSFVATLIGNPDLAVEFCNRALVANRGAPELCNNLAVALAMKGDIGGARAALQSANQMPQTVHEKIVHNATSGLILMRSGDWESGVSSYLESLKLAATQRSVQLWTRAVVNMAREIVPIDAGLASELVTRTEKELDKNEGRLKKISPDIVIMADQVKQSIKIAQIREGAQRVFDEQFAKTLPTPSED